MRRSEPSYDTRYSQPGFYWGSRPTDLCRAVVKLKATLPHRIPSLVDLGTGEGRDLLHFARNGFRTLGIDISPVGLAKAERRAEHRGLTIRVQLGDLRTCRIPGRFDVVFSSGALNNLPRTVRGRRFAKFKGVTIPGGIHAMNAFVPKPYLKPAPEMDPANRRFGPGSSLGTTGIG